MNNPKTTKYQFHSISINTEWSKVMQDLNSALWTLAEFHDMDEESFRQDIKNYIKTNYSNINFGGY